MSSPKKTRKVKDTKFFHSTKNFNNYKMSSYGIKPKDNLSNPNSKRHSYIQFSAQSHIFSDAQKRELKNHLSSDHQCKRPRLSAPILTTDAEYMSKGTEKCDPSTINSKYVLPITGFLINNSQSMYGRFLFDISDDRNWKFWNTASCDLMRKIPLDPSQPTTIYVSDTSSSLTAKNINGTVKVFFDRSINLNSFLSILTEKGFKQQNDISLKDEPLLIRKSSNVNSQIKSKLSSIMRNSYPSSNTWDNNNPYVNVSVPITGRVNANDLDILRDVAHKKPPLRNFMSNNDRKHKLWDSSPNDFDHEEEYNQQLEKEYRLNPQKRKSLLSKPKNDSPASSNKTTVILKKSSLISKNDPKQSLKPITNNTSKSSSTKIQPDSIGLASLDSDDLMSDLFKEIANQENSHLSRRSSNNDSKPSSIFERSASVANILSIPKTKPAMPSCFEEIKQARLQSLNTPKVIVKPEPPPRAVPINPFKNGTVDAAPSCSFTDNSFTLDPGPFLPSKPRIVSESKIVSSTPTITTIEAKVRPSQSTKNIEWFDKIKSNFNESFSFVFKDGKSMDVGPYDVARLNQGEFLNDTIVNFYLKFFLEKHPELKERVHLFNTFFYEKLQVPNEYGKVSNFEKVRKWTAKAKLFSRDFIIIPIHMKMHWYVTIVYNLPALLKPKPETSENSGSTEGGLTRSMRSRDRVLKKRGNVDFNPETDCYIFICDSLQGSRYDSLVKNLKSYFVAEAKDKLDQVIDPSRIISRSVSVPQQTNYSDCGVYLIHFVQCFFDDPDKFAKLMSTHDPVADKELTKVWNPTLMKREILQRMLLYYRHFQENKTNGISDPSDSEDLNSIIKVSSEGVSNQPVEALPVREKANGDAPSEDTMLSKSISKHFKPPTFVSSTDTDSVDRPTKRQLEVSNNLPKIDESLDNNSDTISDSIKLDLKNLEISNDNYDKLPPDVDLEISIDSPNELESVVPINSNGFTAQKSQSVNSQNSYEISLDEDTDSVQAAQPLPKKSITHSSVPKEISQGHTEKKRLRSSRADPKPLLSDDDCVSSFSDAEDKSIVSIDDDSAVIEELKPHITTKSLQPGLKKKLEFKEKVDEQASKLAKGSNSKKDNDENGYFIEHAFPPLSSFRMNPKGEKPSSFPEKDPGQTSPARHSKKTHSARSRQTSTEEKPLVVKHNFRRNISTSGVSFKNARELEPITISSSRPHTTRKSVSKKAKAFEEKLIAANQAAISAHDNDEDDDIQIVDCQSSKPTRKKRN